MSAADFYAEKYLKNFQLVAERIEIIANLFCSSSNSEPQSHLSVSVVSVF